MSDYRPGQSRLTDDLLGDDELLSTAELADLFRVGIQTATRWCASGRIPNTPDGRPGLVRVGGHYRVRKSIARGLLNGEIELREVSGGVNKGEDS
jgi:helix-turn-helix protein